MRRVLVAVALLIASSVVVPAGAGAVPPATGGEPTAGTVASGTEPTGGSTLARVECPSGLGGIDASANRTYGGPANESVAAAELGSGLVLVGGATTSYTGAPPLRQDVAYDAWVVGLHPNGTEAWNRSYGDDGFEGLRALVPSDGGYYVVGAAENTSTDVRDREPWVVRADANGTALWNRTVGGDGDRFNDAAPDGDGGLYVVGETVVTDADSGNEHSQGWIVHLAGNGTVLDERAVGTYTDRYGKSDAFYGVEPTHDGYLVTGSTSSYTPRNFDVPWLLKLDANGTEVWNRTYFVDRQDAYTDRRIRDVHERADGSLVLVGEVGTQEAGGWIAGVDRGGYRWERAYTASIDRFETLVAVDRTGYLLAGSTWACSPEDSYADNWLLKLDAGLGVKWAGTYGGPGQDQLATAVRPRPGALWLVGSRGQYGNGGDASVLELPIDPGVPGVTASTHPPQDSDGDGQYEDVTGDGQVDIIDVATFLDAFDRSVVTERVAAFDFDGSGGIDILDVAALLGLV